MCHFHVFSELQVQKMADKMKQQIIKIIFYAFGWDGHISKNDPKGSFHDSSWDPLLVLVSSPRGLPFRGAKMSNLLKQSYTNINTF